MKEINAVVEENGPIIEVKLEGETNIYNQTPEQIKQNLNRILVNAQEKYKECTEKLKNGSMSWYPCGFASLYVDPDHAKILKKTVLKALDSENGNRGLIWKFDGLVFEECKPYKSRKTIEIDFMALHSHQELNLKEQVLSTIRNVFAQVFGLSSNLETMLD